MNEAQQRFIDGWRIAGPELERIRNEELRQLESNRGAQMMSKATPRDAQFSGLAIWQSWMMRLRVLELLESSSGDD